MINFKTINIEEWKKIFENNGKIIILDVRTLDEFNQGHIKDAINIDFYDKNIYEKLSKFDINKKYLIYCRSGIRSFKTLKIMKKLNFNYVLDLEGGILNWISKNYQLVK